MLLNKIKTNLRRLALLGMACAVSACMGGQSFEDASRSTFGAVDGNLHKLALLEAKQKQAKGQRIWCVPFARTASGIDLRGDAKHWWHAAKGEYARGHKPQPGAVMAFGPTKGMTSGHVAVVSDVVNTREIRINHANWVRNAVQLDMKVIDISPKNDWTQVKVERVRGEMGLTAYPVNGFIYPS